jgi:hypothetical protein
MNPKNIIFRFALAQDWEMDLYLSSQGHICHYPDSPSVLHCLRSGSRSANKFSVARRRLHNLLKLDLGPVTTAVSFADYVVRSSVKFLFRLKPGRHCNEEIIFPRNMEAAASHRSDQSLQT